MSLGKLITVLKSVDENDIGQLFNYIHSPYFKVPAASVRLFDYLYKIHPDYNDKNTSTEVIGKKVENLSNYSKQARAASELLDAILHFLSVEDWQSDNRNVQWHSFHRLKQLDLFEKFETEYNKFVASVDSDAEQNINTFYFRHIFTELTFNGFDAKLNRTQQNDITPTLRTLDEFYALKQLRYLCEVVSRKQVLGTAYHQVNTDWLLSTLAPVTTTNHPYVYLFVNVYKMIAADTFEASEPFYKLIKDFIGDYKGETLPDDVEEVIIYAVNWCLTWLGKGHEMNAIEYLWWIELKIKYSVLIQDNKIMPITFRNIATSAVLSGKSVDWLQRFIEQYEKFLPQEYNESYVAFAKGLNQYQTKNYTKATQWFLQAQAKEEVIFNAIIRRWQYMSSYESNKEDVDLLLNQLLAFEKYLQRNTDAFKHIGGGFAKFISYSKKQLNINSKEKALTFKSELLHEEYFPGKTWLLSIINDKSNK